MHSLIRIVASAVGVATLGVGLHATRLAPYRPVLRRRTLRVPPNWPHLEILHLSDLHLRRSDQALFCGQLRALAALRRQPDLVCVTGDLCEQLADAPMVAELLRNVHPRLGTYMIPGNHEYSAGSPRGAASRGASVLAQLLGRVYAPVVSSGMVEGEAIATALRQMGLRVLRNQGVRLEVGDRRLWLGGVDSGWAGLARVGGALRDRRADEGALVMVHEPELAFEAVELGADLVLAGHTHGGQVRVPLFGPLYWHRVDARLQIAAGVQSIGMGQLHVSAGSGQMVPLRLACPPELVWLRCQPSAQR